MKNFDTNELNTEKIVKLLNSRIIVNENGYDAIKNRQIYRYIKYEESNQILILINLKNIKKRRCYELSSFIKKSFLNEYSKKRKNLVSCFNFKRRFLLDIEAFLKSTEGITVQAKEKIIYIINRFFFADINGH